MIARPCRGPTWTGSPSRTRWVIPGMRGEHGREPCAAALRLGEDGCRLGAVDHGGLARRRVDQQVGVVVGELGDRDDLHWGLILDRDGRALGLVERPGRCRGPTALLHPKEALA